MQAAWDWTKENWQFVVTVAIAVPGLVALWFARRPRRLDYRVDVKAPVMNSVAASLFDGLQAVLAIKNDEGVNVTFTDPQLTLISIINTGKREVMRQHFSRPISIRIGDQRGLYGISWASDAYVVQPADLTWVPDFPNDPSRHMEGELRISPYMMNPGDGFQVQILSNYYKGQPAVAAKIASESRQMQRLPPLGYRDFWQPTLRDVGIAGGTVTATMTLVVAVVPEKTLPIWLGLLALVAALATASLGIRELVVDWRTARRRKRALASRHKTD